MLQAVLGVLRTFLQEAPHNCKDENMLGLFAPTDTPTVYCAKQFTPYNSRAVWISYPDQECFDHGRYPCYMQSAKRLDLGLIHR